MEWFGVAIASGVHAGGGTWTKAVIVSDCSAQLSNGDVSIIYSNSCLHLLVPMMSPDTGLASDSMAHLSVKFQ